MVMTDEQREEMLETLGLRFQFASSQDERRELWAEIKLLINGRSKAQIERMEIQKGLRTCPEAAG